MKVLSRSGQFKEIWVQAHGSAMCILVNEHDVVLHLTTENNEVGFTTRNADREDRPIEFQLDNGQVDTYSYSWTYDLNVCGAVVDEFIATGSLPTSVKWHDDGST